MVRTMEEIASVRVEATETMTALLASIAGVSLRSAARSGLRLAWACPRA